MSNTELTTTGRDRFLVDMPDNAPALGFDPAAPSMSWRDVYPSNYWNLDDLQAKRAQLGGWPVVDVARVTVKPVFDPADYDGKEPPPEALIPRLVLEFATGPALVLNKSRCLQLEQLAGTPDPRQWAGRVKRVCLEAGIFGGKAQIIVKPAD